MENIAGIYRFDAYERRILAELQRDCRITNQELAERVHLSPSACWRRTQALEESGIIRAHVALVDPDKVGLEQSVFAHVKLEKHSQELIDRFREMVMNRPEILECYAMTGVDDYMLKIVVPNVKAYDAFLSEFIADFSGIAHIHSQFVLHQIKQSTELPIGLHSVMS